MLEEEETTGGMEVDATSDSTTPRPFRFEPKRASASAKLSTSNISETNNNNNSRDSRWHRLIECSETHKLAFASAGHHYAYALHT